MVRRIPAAVAMAALLGLAAGGPSWAQQAPTPPPPATQSALPAPDMRTTSWVLADLDTGEILAMRNPDELRRPASTLKLLTVLTVAPRLNPRQPYRAVRADEEAEGNRVVLYAGLRYKVSDLIHAALMPSANDAANALAHANGGVERTLDQMSAEAARLGATSTTARNPSGLDEPDQFTTARDLAAIGRAAFENPEIAEYLKLSRVSFPGKRAGDGRVTYPIYSHNRLLQDPRGGSIGGKSGYTSGAGRTFVGAADRDGHRLLVSMLGIGGNIYRSADRLLDWGFANYSSLTPVGALARPSAPAPQFERPIRPLPPRGEIPSPDMLGVSDAPLGPSKAFALNLPGFLPSPLTLLTWVVAFVAIARARRFWLDHRARTAWQSLEEWPGRGSPASPATGGVEASNAAAGRANGSRTNRSGANRSGANRSGANARDDREGLVRAQP